VRKLLLLSLLSILIGEKAQAQTPIDPLKLPQAEIGTYIYTFGVNFTPDSQRRVNFDEFGRPFVDTILYQNLSTSFTGSYSFDKSLSMAGGVNYNLSLEDQKQENADFKQYNHRSFNNVNGGLSLEYRIAPGSALEPRLSVGVNYPWVINAQSSISLLKDPVILLASLGYNKPLQNTADSVTIGLGAGFVANDNINFSASGSYTMPLGDVDVPVTSLSLRTGYNLDPKGNQELGFKTLLNVSARETTIGFGIEFGGRGNLGTKPILPPPELLNNSTNNPRQNPPSNNIQSKNTAVENNPNSLEELKLNLKEKDQQIENLQKQINDLQKRLDTLEKLPK
jgi:hypothetical protein